MNAASVLPSVTTAFPPSFDDNPWTFGLALFSLTLVSSLSVAQLLYYWFERRVRLLADTYPEPPLPFWSLVNVHRLIVSGFLLTIVLGALPDVVVLLAWGETSATTMEVLFAIDRLGDGALLAPFLGASILSAWTHQAIPQRLVSQASVQLAAPKFWMVRDRLKIAALVFIISLGVTFAKASV